MSIHIYFVKVKPDEASEPPGLGRYEADGAVSALPCRLSRGRAARAGGDPARVDHP